MRVESRAGSNVPVNQIILIGNVAIVVVVVFAVATVGREPRRQQKRGTAGKRIACQDFVFLL